MDISRTAIDIARTTAEQEQIENIVSVSPFLKTEMFKEPPLQVFHVADAGALPADWTSAFDFVTVFDACHDQLRPDLVGEHIHTEMRLDDITEDCRISAFCSKQYHSSVSPRSTGCSNHTACSPCSRFVSNVSDPAQ